MNQKELNLNPDLNPKIEDKDYLIGKKRNRYHPPPGLLPAVNVALTLERPLLLTGEPGCGKTDFAWAAANALGEILNSDAKEKEPLQCYVRSYTQAKDLLYTYDSVSRFGDANHNDKEGNQRALDTRNYIELEPLGLGLMSPTRRVVLIDEIDKAPRDLPNDLLWELDQNRFEIMEIPFVEKFDEEIYSHNIPLKREMYRPSERRDAKEEELAGPLVIITSNVERQLPDAFLRRCIFFHIPFPKESLPKILAEYFPEYDVNKSNDKILEQAMAIFMALREIPGLTRKPGTAELIDWVTAITRVFSLDKIRPAIEEFADLVNNKDPNLPWKKLPGLTCLVKLRDDLVRLEI